MRRRDLLAGAALAAASAGFPGPAIGRGARRLTMVTDWPDGPGPLPSARRLARAIADASAGRLDIAVSPSGAVVRPFETFDAVEAGVADMFHSHIGYFDQKLPAFHFFSAVPYGFTANELFAWMRFGGGQDLFDAAAAAFNMKLLLCCSTGAQMGGWYLSELASTAAIKGMRYRMAGLGAEVYRRLGATVVLLSGADIVQSLRSGAIDACEWIGPWLDMEMGLHRVARFYYYPAWHEPGAGLALGINKAVWESLAETDRRIIENAAAGEYTLSLAEFNANNAAALRKLRTEGEVAVRRFDAAMLKTFAEISQDVVAEAGAGDALSRDIHRSYLEFRGLVREWSETGEGAYLDAQRTA